MPPPVRVFQGPGEFCAPARAGSARTATATNPTRANCRQPRAEGLSVMGRPSLLEPGPARHRGAEGRGHPATIVAHAPGTIEVRIRTVAARRAAPRPWSTI